jgi:hypothetical protein
MSAGGTTTTIYFAWVAPNTPWGGSLLRFDENIFDLVIEHDEGQIPTATIEVKNPRIGLINPSRLYWAWMSYQVGASNPQPMFFGRLVGIPEQIAQNTVKMKFITRDDTYIFQKQQVARSLKVLPNYDPIFFEVAKRDDPDAILEGWSALYHVDRVNGRVSASDILVGEDGTMQFAPQDVFYDSVQCKLLQSPLVAVNVKAEVNWEQQWRGAFFVGQWAWGSLTGVEPFVGDWPKSGSSLGGGWSVGVAWAGHRDPTLIQTTQAQQFLQTQQLQQAPYTFSWTNQAKKHTFGDTMSININYTPPFGTAVLLKTVQQIGLQNPYAVDFNGDPAPVNIPAKITQDWFCYKTLQQRFLSTESVAVLSLVYAADRKRSERLEMTVMADVQPILTDPLLVEDTEQITLKSGDLSLPLIDLLNWDSVGFGGGVSAGQFIFPDNPLLPGQTSTQIALNSGNTGSVFPTFSNIAGQTTADGSVIWVSLGSTQPTESAQDWSRFLNVPLGALLIPKPVSGVPDFDSIKIPGTLNYPPTGSAVPRYSIFSAGNGGPGDAMYECVDPGLLGGTGPQAGFSTFTNPSGQTMYIAIAAGTTGEFHSTFNEGTMAQTTDGSVIWQSLGPVSLPIGGWPGGTPAATYFPQGRGQQSVQHMLCRARAKLRKRARAVEVSFDTRFELAVQLSCRMNAAVTDPRLPGTTVYGKVVSYKIEAHGDSGVLKGSVVLGCSIGTNVIGGFGPVASTGWSPGPIDYAGDQIGYSPPVSDPNDDGLVFPASSSDLILQNEWHGTPSNPEAYEIFNIELQQQIKDAIQQAKASAKAIPPPPGSISKTPISVTAAYDIATTLQVQLLQSSTQGQALWYELVLKPLTNGPFASSYVVATSDLLIPQTINLSAGSAALGMAAAPFPRHTVEPRTVEPPMPSYVEDGYADGYQRYYSSVSGAPSGQPPEQGVAFPVPPLPPNWPSRPPTLPDLGSGQ